MTSSSSRACPSSTSGSPAPSNQLVIPGLPPSGATYDWLRNSMQKFTCFISEQMPATIAHREQEIAELNEKLRLANAEIEQKDAAMKDIWDTYLENSVELTKSYEESAKLKDQVTEHESTIAQLKGSIRRAATVKPTPDPASIVSKVEDPSSISIPSAIKLDPAQLAGLCDPSQSVKREQMSPRAQDRPSREEVERRRGNHRDSHQESYQDNRHPHPSCYYGSTHAQTHRSNGYQSGRGSYSNNGYRRGFNRPY